MKAKIYLLLILGNLSFLQLSAQQLQNPSFDSVYYGGIDRVWNWVTSDAMFMGGNLSGDTMQPQQANTFFGQGHEVFGNIDVYNASPYSSIAIKLNTTGYKKNNGDPFDTYIVNGDHYYTGDDGYIDFSKCGVPFPYRPDSLKGFYQYIDSNLATTDYGHCIILLKKYNSSLGKSDTIAYTVDSSAFGSNSWTGFSLPINYFSSAQPDSLVVIFRASTRPFEGSSFWLDNLEFVYSPNSISEVTNTKKIPIVYPNPNFGIISVKENDFKISSYRLIDINGCTIMQGKFKNDIAINTGLDDVVFLELRNGNKLIKTFKVIRD